MKLSVSYLKPGMVLKSPVYSSRGRLLLNSGRVLTSTYIQALKRVGVLAVNVKGVDDLDIEEADRVLSDEVKSRSINLYSKFC